MKLSTNTAEETTHIALKDAVSGISKAMTLFAGNLAQMYAEYDFDEMLKAISKSLDELTEVLVKSGCDANCIESYKKWGNYGWSFSPSVDYSLFKKSSSALEEANVVMEKYLNDDEIDKIIYALEIADVNSNELKEAKTCYNQKMYKACTLLLFGIIDCKLYKYGLLNKKRDKVLLGKGFAEKYSEIKKYDNFYLQEILINIIQTIIKVFENGNNFKNKMTIINRNYLSHGMSQRDITQLECFQVWCLTYSVWVLLDVIEECDKDALGYEQNEV